MKADLKGVWFGSNVVCLASGPSVTDADINAVKLWRNGGAGRFVIATNSMVFKAPWVDAVFGMDSAWWRYYLPSLNHYKGLRLTCAIDQRGVITLPMPVSGNSGLASMFAAKYLGASRLILVGFDLRRGAQGQAHNHPDHPAPLTNTKSIQRWPGQFVDAMGHFENIEIVNTNQGSRLRMWYHQPLEQALAEPVPA